MQKTREQIYEALMRAGCRVTSARKEIIALLTKVTNPQSIQEMVVQVNANEASVYRSIAVFHSIGMVEEIVGSDGVKRYALKHGHHDHIVCRGCGFTAHIPCDIKKSKSIPRSTEFATIDDHTLTYHGVCTRCAT